MVPSRRRATAQIFQILRRSCVFERTIFKLSWFAQHIVTEVLAAQYNSLLKSLIINWVLHIHIVFETPIHINGSASYYLKGQPNFKRIFKSNKWVKSVSSVNLWLLIGWFLSCGGVASGRALPTRLPHLVNEKYCNFASSTIWKTSYGQKTWT